MGRWMVFGVPLVSVLLPGAVLRAGSQRDCPPATYELMINGETFLVEANRLHKLESKQNPGVTYEVALRLAPMQRLALDTVVFAYDRLSEVERGGRQGRRSVRLSHELGFTMLITDLGRPLDGPERDEVLRTLARLAGKTFGDQGEQGPGKVRQGKPHTRKFAGATGRGVVLQYRDRRGLDHTCLVYVLGGPKFAVSCVIEYLDRDSRDVLPLVRKTLDSFRAVD